MTSHFYLSKHLFTIRDIVFTALSNWLLAFFGQSSGSRSGCFQENERCMRGKGNTTGAGPRILSQRGGEEFPLTDWMLGKYCGNLRFPAKQWSLFSRSPSLSDPKLAPELPTRNTTHFLSSARWQGVRALQKFHTNGLRMCRRLL